MARRPVAAIPFRRQGRAEVVSLRAAVALIGLIAAAPLAAAAADRTVQIELHVIGFEVNQSVAKKLEEMAAAGGGVYYNSSGEAQLTAALGQAVGVSGATQAEPTETSESEPNSRIGDADHVAIDGAFEGAIKERGDVDWLRLTIPKRGALHLESTAAPATIDLAFRVLDDNFQPISGWFGAPKPGDVLQADVDFPRGGSYWLELRDGHDDAGSDEPYRLVLKFDPSADRAEPNDRPGDATPFKPGETIAATILPRGDVDLYRFDVPARGALTVDVTDVPAALDVVLRVWNRHGQAFTNWQGPQRVGAETHAVFDLPEPGSYFLEARDGNDDARAAEPFKLKISFAGAIDNVEPNDQIGNAVAIKIGDVVSATVLPRGDVDFYRFEVERKGRLAIDVIEVPAALDIVARVWNRHFEPITGWLGPPRPGAETHATADLPERGVYFLELRDGNDDARSEAPFKLTLGFAAAIEAGEPNNRLADATRLTFDQAVTANILPRGDADWYVIETGGAGPLSVTISAVPPALDVVFRVWDRHGQPISGWFGPPRPGADTVAAFAMPEAGAYYIEVHDGNDNEAAAEPYTLLASFAGPKPTPPKAPTPSAPSSAAPAVTDPAVPAAQIAPETPQAPVAPQAPESEPLRPASELSDEELAAELLNALGAPARASRSFPMPAPSALPESNGEATPPDDPASMLLRSLEALPPTQ